MKPLIYSLFLLLLGSGLAAQQHDHHSSGDSSRSKQSQITAPPMSHAFSLRLPMTRNGSGTGWLPDSTPMYGYMFHSGRWMFMGHGNVFFRYNRQDLLNAGQRGGEELDVVNWFMFMGQRRVGRSGLFRFSSMLSLDALSGNNGYPLLFQTGETYQGKPLVDRQHPHDLFSELSVAYTQSLSSRADVFVYAGYPGEPALGSVAFMHRVSSLYSPTAPLSHHWNDGTHITFGVLTGGLRLGRFKMEGSVFNGREPGEERYNFDPPRLNSYSGRLSFNPNAYWSFQLSQGFIRSPEASHPGDDVYRSTASVIYSRPLKAGNFLSVTGLWGLNRGHGSEQAALLEAGLVLKRWALYSRYEFVQKTSEELNLDATVYGSGEVYPINAITVGMNYDVFRTKFFRAALGTQLSYYAADPRLNGLYGRNPVSAEVFIRLSPPRMF